MNVSLSLLLEARVLRYYIMHVEFLIYSTKGMWTCRSVVVVVVMVVIYGRQEHAKRRNNSSRFLLFLVPKKLSMFSRMKNCVLSCPLTFVVVISGTIRENSSNQQYLPRPA